MPYMLAVELFAPVTDKLWMKFFDTVNKVGPPVHMIPTTFPSNSSYELLKLNMVLPVTDWFPERLRAKIPITDENSLIEPLLLEMVRSRIVLSATELTPSSKPIPTIRPVTAPVAPFRMFDIVFPVIVTVDDAPVLDMPKTHCAAKYEVEVALILPAVVVLPMVLLIIVVVPEAEVMIP